MTAATCSNREQSSVGSRELRALCFCPVNRCRFESQVETKKVVTVGIFWVTLCFQSPALLLLDVAMDRACSRAAGCVCSMCAASFGAVDRALPTPKSREFEGMAWSASYTRPGARDQAFEAAGRAVIARARLDIDGRADAGKYRPLDCVFCDTETGGLCLLATS